jgi:hypothetical protein
MPSVILTCTSTSTTSTPKKEKVFIFATIYLEGFARDESPWRRFGGEYLIRSENQILRRIVNWEKNIATKLGFKLEEKFLPSVVKLEIKSFCKTRTNHITSRGR